MLKIATHDSATGEESKNLLHLLFVPFARTQSKTIKEQYDAGCRMFDLRVRFTDGNWHCAHGLWFTKRTALDIISDIGAFEDTCYVTLTYEGGKGNVEGFKKFVNHIKKEFPNIVWGGIALKYGEGSNLFKVKYEYLEKYPKGFPSSKQAFKVLDGRSWHIILPIPWLWKKIYFNKPQFDNKTFQYVDFL